MTSIHRVRVVEHSFYGRVRVFDADDSISRTILRDQEWEREIADRMCREIVEGTDVLDVGANLGFSTLGMLMRGAKPRVVHCFEPQPDVHALLQYNVRNSPNVHTYNFGLSANASDVLGYDQVLENIGGTQLHHVYKNRYHVATTSLDRMLQDDFFENVVSLVKIDVEAHEGPLLRGARGFFKRHRPIIFIEIFNELVPEITRQLADDHDYVLDQHLGGWDYVFAPRERRATNR